MIYRAMIIPILTYCSPVVLSYCPTKHNKINRLENRIEHVISYGRNVDLKLPSVKNMISNRTCTLVYDSLNGHTCELFENYFKLLEHSHNTRHNKKSIYVPKVNTESCKKAFFFLGAKLFNDLPLHVRNMDDRSLFKSGLKKVFE